MSRRWLLILGLCWAVGGAQADEPSAEPSAELSAELSPELPAELSAEGSPRRELATVIVLSWDGLRHDYLELHGADGGLPALTRLATQGVRAKRMTPVFPSNTFPGHVSIATGTFPDTHGIVDNRFFDRQQGPYLDRSDANWLQAEPLWIAAERQGIPAATYFWVGSETDWHGQGTRYRISPFDGDRPEAEKVDQILAWLQLPPGERPQLIMSYWAGADGPGHDFGPESRRVTAQLREQDAQLARLLQGLDVLGAWSSTTLILVGDHGMTATGRYLDVRGALAEAGIEARVVGSPVANVFLDDPEQLAAARAALASLDPVEVFEGPKLPATLRLRHPTRTGDLVVVTRPPYVLSRPDGFRGLLVGLMSALGWTFGGHGYDPTLPDMGTAFLAMGRGVAAGLQLDDVNQIDVAATVARLLDMEPPLQSEGRPIAGIGEGPDGTLGRATGSGDRDEEPGDSGGVGVLR